MTTTKNTTNNYPNLTINYHQINRQQLQKKATKANA